ncbi:hypothetical protein QFC19_009027 [Naganishia cerealis]|uniref:Uncharacterized protein n=1 Tax=Naganishia cerealis TaxID=610337 RepID=A0ACC2UYL7_9TREE|nr:hypothetical protein QFC19_009027 [Naganishia cerealis]
MPLNNLRAAFRPAVRATRGAATSANSACQLAFDTVEPQEHDKQLVGQSLVICHGLFGSKQNWRSLSKTFAKRLGVPVYTVDLRNHGHSPHVRPHDYSHMAQDLSRFMRERGLAERGGVNLLGHSMQDLTRVSPTLRLCVGRLLMNHITCVLSARLLAHRFEAYTKGMQEIEDAKLRTKAEGDKLLQTYEKVCSCSWVQHSSHYTDDSFPHLPPPLRMYEPPQSLPTRQFLLTNALTDPTSQTLRFRIPLDILRDSIPSIGEFPYVPPSAAAIPEAMREERETASWSGPTLFIKGAHSKYINARNLPICRAFFPNMEMETLEAGHWVHAERPREFVDAVERFIRANTAKAAAAAAA